MQTIFTWDKNKALSNFRMHGLSFEEAVEVFDDPFGFEKYDSTNSNLDEDRYIVFGRIKRQIVVIGVYTAKNGTKRIISAR